MFTFGKPRDAVDLYYGNIVNTMRQKSHVPEFVRAPADEMTEEQLRAALTFVLTAYESAQGEGMEEGLLDVMKDDYLSLACQIAEVSDVYRDWATSPAGRFINEHDKKKKLMYRKYIGLHLLFKGLGTKAIEKLLDVSQEQSSAD